MATGTLSPDVLDPFTWHLAIVLLAVTAGWLMLAGLRALHPALGGFPLFPLAMIGGMLIQVAAERTGLHEYFDRATFQRITGVALDLLVVAAVAALPLDLFLQSVVPFALLMLAGIAWVVGSFVWLAPRMLGAHWFEQGIVVFGTQSGVAAVGLMLLRIVDPETRTPAAQAFAARSMVTSPLLGGGLVTATMPLLVQQFGVAVAVSGVIVLMAGAWLWPGPRPVTD
jgi:ESS family glutamate:Na+ symporter